jgi:hypothetical protein
MSNLNRDMRADAGRIDEPIDRTRHHASAEELLARSDHHGAVRRPNSDHEHCFAKSAGQSAALANREARESSVRADDGAIREYEWTFGERRRIGT